MNTRLALALLLLPPWRLAQAADLAEFERHAIRARQLGATHVVITDDIPPSLWQFDTPGDPYPAWFLYQPGLMKIFPPAQVQPYVNQEYAEKVAALLQARCAVLRRHGLKAAYTTNEPQVLPEKFFTDYPEWRGPRVDQPNRSRTARFAPCVDRPEVLRLYREAMQLLLKLCPEVEIFSFLTTDSGSGLCWSAGLYPGANGNSACQRRPMDERVAGFLVALREAASEMGRHIQADLHGIRPRQWMLPTFDRPELMAHKLPEGLAVDGFEGPDGRRMAMTRFGAGGGAFYPVVGLPRAAGAMRSLMASPRQKSSPLVVSFGDPESMDLSFRVLEAFQRAEPRNELEMLAALRELAVQPAGQEGAGDLLTLWLSLDEAERYLGALDFGPVLTMGCVLGRWVTRPFVPIPSELTAGEKKHYQPFLFQAKGEEQAGNLIDIQAMRMFEGWGARLLVQRVIEMVTASLVRAEASAARLRAAKTPAAAAEWELLGQRLAVLQSLLKTVDNAVAYQAQLDRVQALAAKPEPNPVLGTQSGWDRQDLMRIARDEIDNAARLRRLLETVHAPLVDTAPTPAEETIRRLGPDLAAQIKRKIDVMNAHWEDYKRLFTTPNQ